MKKETGGSEGDFKGFFIYLIIFAFLVSFWNSFRADMERRDGVGGTTVDRVQRGQVVKQKLYPATVYYRN